jgi:hypothetical protein
LAIAAFTVIVLVQDDFAGDADPGTDRHHEYDQRSQKQQAWNRNELHAY